MGQPRAAASLPRSQAHQELRDVCSITAWPWLLGELFPPCLLSLQGSSCAQAACLMSHSLAWGLK